MGRAFASLVLAAVVAACAGVQPSGLSGDSSPAASIPPVVRAVLAAGDPSAAPGQHLELVRYTIQPGTQLALHRHPGMQLAFIESGTLTYTVEQGEVIVHQPDGKERSVKAGSTGTLAAGEWIAETEGVVHFGVNDGLLPVVILAASLLETGQPPAIAVSPVPSAP